MPDWDPDAIHGVKWWSFMIPVLRWLKGSQVSTRRRNKVLVYILKKQDFDELENILGRLKDKPEMISNEVLGWMHGVMKEEN